MIKWSKPTLDISGQGSIEGEGFGKFIQIVYRKLGKSLCAKMDVGWTIFNAEGQFYITGNEYKSGSAISIQEAKRMCYEELCPTSIKFIEDLAKEIKC